MPNSRSEEKSEIMKRILIGAIGSVVVLVGIILSQPLEKSAAQMEGSSKSDVRAESAKRSPSVARQFLASLGLEYSAESFVLAASNGDHVAAQAYIDSGMDVNAASENGRTALMEAALKDHLEIARMLLEAGANPNAVNDQGRSPLYRAAFNGHANTVSLLLKVRASLTLLAARPVQCPHGVLH